MAYPSYQSFVIKTRRGDAQSELIKAQIEQSSYRIIHPTYISNISSTGLPSNHPYYTFSIVHSSANTYTMKAEAKLASTQHSDTDECKTLYINQNNIKTSDGSTENAACWIH
ncbi:type IV pilin protein [Psychromonas sp.]|nr:type IV pilin protein [Psychromonas sp.]